MYCGTLCFVVRPNVIDISDERANSMSAVLMEAVRFIATYPVYQICRHIPEDTHVYPCVHVILLYVCRFGILPKTFPARWH